MRLGRGIVLTLLCVAVAALAWSCASGSGRSGTAHDSAASPADATPLPDTLVVGTLYSPTSYFIYRDQPMGYNYELISRYAADRQMPVRVELADNFHELLEMLGSGKVHVLAYEIPKTAEYKAQVLHCGPENETHQVLVQPLRNGRPEITDVTRLPGRKVVVEKDSKYYYRLLNLNREVGGGIEIQTVSKDSVVTEDMIEMVAAGEIPLTVIDSDIARVSRTYYDDIDVSLPIGMEQRSSWAVAKEATALAADIDAWTRGNAARAENKALYRRYYEMSKQLPEADGAVEGARGAMLGDGRISQYDDIFRRYAASIGWDWRLLAAQAYNESHFDNDAVSWAGARGLMQLMPRTAAAMGLQPGEITNPDLNVQAAVKAISALDKMFARKVPDRRERLKFIVAAYNSGGAHILDAITIARKTGLDPQVWDGNVEQALLLKSRPEYYRDPEVKAGYFKGTQTVRYVKRVMDTFEMYKNKIHS